MMYSSIASTQPLTGQTTCAILRIFPIPPRKDHVAFEHESLREGKPMLEYAK
jgi:hypothetical protein